MAGKANEKLFLEACKKKFKEEPTQMETKYYCYGGWKQSKSKVEFQEKAKLTLVSATSIVEGGAHDVIQRESRGTEK